MDLQNENPIVPESLDDIFPSEILSQNKFPQKVSIEVYLHHTSSTNPFVLFKFSGATHVSFFVDLPDDEPAMRPRLHRLLKSCELLDDRTGKKNVAWSRLDDAYNKLPICLRKRETAHRVRPPTKKRTAAAAKQREDHADTRLGFRFANMFAVKAFFTFGERKIRPNEVHIVQTYAVPLLYNEVKSEFKEQLDWEWETGERQEARFVAAEQGFFDTFVLNPYSVYAIPEGTIYVLISVQKTLFALDRVSNETFETMVSGGSPSWRDVTFLKPNSQKKLMAEIADPYPRQKKMRLSVAGCSSSSSIDRRQQFIYNDELLPPQLMRYPAASTSSAVTTYPTHPAASTSSAATTHFGVVPAAPTIYFEQCLIMEPVVSSTPSTSREVISSSSSADGTSSTIVTSSRQPIDENDVFVYPSTAENDDYIRPLIIDEDALIATSPSEFPTQQSPPPLPEILDLSDLEVDVPNFTNDDETRQSGNESRLIEDEGSKLHQLLENLENEIKKGEC